MVVLVSRKIQSSISKSNNKLWLSPKWGEMQSLSKYIGPCSNRAGCVWTNQFFKMWL